MLQILGLLSGTLSAICYVPYIADILKGKTKPERASWLIWGVLGYIAFFSQLAKGATDSLWLTGIQSVGISIIFLLSLKYGVGGLTGKDIFALIAAAAGLALWFLTKEAAVALFIIIGIDAIGGFLTILKAYRYPSSETLVTWVLAGLSGILATFAVGNLNWILLTYPFYTFLLNSLVILAIILGKKKHNG